MTDTDTRADARAVARRAWEDMVNRQRLDLADELYAPTFEFHDPAHVFIGATVDTPERMRATLGRFQQVFPDLTYHIEDLVAEGDRAVIRWRQTSTHRQPLLPGVAATGQRVEVTGIELFEVRHGRIVREVAEWDLLGLLRQVGAAPEGPVRAPAPVRPAPPSSVPAEDTETPEANRRTAVRVFTDLMTGGELAAVDQVYAPDVEFHDAGLPEPVVGRDAVRSLLLGLRTAFPDLDARVLETVAEGDRVVVRWSMSGTHRGAGPAPGMAPTGRSFTATGMDWFRLADGLVVEERSEWDVFGAFRQLGLIPDGPAQPSAAPDGPVGE